MTAAKIASPTCAENQGRRQEVGVQARQRRHRSPSLMGRRAEGDGGSGRRAAGRPCLQPSKFLDSPVGEGPAFVGASLADLRRFPAEAGGGFQVDAAQRGLDPTDWKPLSTVGAGARAAVLNMRADLMGDLRELKRPLVYGRITIVPRPSGSMSGAGASTQGSPSAPTPSESCRTTGSPRGSGSMHPCQSPSAVSRVVSRWRRPSERTATTATTAGITRAAASHGFVRRA